MKKAAFVLALVMLLGCVSGCGAAEGEASVQSVSMIPGRIFIIITNQFLGADIMGIFIGFLQSFQSFGVLLAEVILLAHIVVVLSQ